MRADDQLVRAFPQVLACGETLPPGDLPVPWDHPIVRQTIDDCLEEAMDAEGMVHLLRGLRQGTIRRVAVDTTEPSPYAQGVLNAMPYAFLDDAPLEERRTQAVMRRRVSEPSTVDSLGALDPEAVARVREEAWPQIESAEELHESLLWMGFVTREEILQSGWSEWADELLRASRVTREGEKYFAVEAEREAKEILRGRLEALGPVFTEGSGRYALPPGSEQDLLALEQEGVVEELLLAPLRRLVQARQAGAHPAHPLLRQPEPTQ